MSIKKELQNIIKNSLAISFKDLSIDPTSIVIETPKNEVNGDYATNVAMSLAGKLKCNPIEIANKIADNISDKAIEKVIVAPPY